MAANGDGTLAHKYVLDTHALIWYLEGNPRLGQAARDVIDDADSELVLPIIALAEAVFIVEHGRTGIPDVQSLLDAGWPIRASRSIR